MPKAENVSAVYYTTTESPPGDCCSQAMRERCGWSVFERSKRSAPPGVDWKLDKEPFAEAIRQLQAYFRGELKEFDLPLAMEGTEFQLRVWMLCALIPLWRKRFHTRSLLSASEIVERCARWDWPTGAIASPSLCRCHRVIGSDGSLTGFGGGLSTKKMLLELENKQLSLL